jgi:hypothetical protein
MTADLAERIDQWAKRNGKAMRHLLEPGLRAPKRKASK